MNDWEDCILATLLLIHVVLAILQ